MTSIKSQHLRSCEPQNILIILFSVNILFTLINCRFKGLDGEKNEVRNKTNSHFVTIHFILLKDLSM